MFASLPLPSSFRLKPLSAIAGLLMVAGAVPAQTIDGPITKDLTLNEPSTLVGMKDADEFIHIGDVIYQRNSTLDAPLKVIANAELTLDAANQKERPTDYYNTTQGALHLANNAWVDLQADGQTINVISTRNNVVMMDANEIDQKGTVSIKAASLKNYRDEAEKQTALHNTKTLVYIRPEGKNYRADVTFDVDEVRFAGESGINTRGKATKEPKVTMAVTGNLVIDTFGQDHSDKASDVAYPNSGRVLTLGQTDLTIGKSLTATADFSEYAPLNSDRTAFDAMALRIADASKVTIGENLELEATGIKNGAAVDIRDGQNIDTPSALTVKGDTAIHADGENVVGLRAVNGTVTLGDESSKSVLIDVKDGKPGTLPSSVDREWFNTNRTGAGILVGPNARVALTGKTVEINTEGSAPALVSYDGQTTITGDTVKIIAEKDQQAVFSTMEREDGGTVNISGKKSLAVVGNVTATTPSYWFGEALTQIDLQSEKAMTLDGDIIANPYNAIHATAADMTINGKMRIDRKNNSGESPLPEESLILTADNMTLNLTDSSEIGTLAGKTIDVMMPQNKPSAVLYVHEIAANTAVTMLWHTQGDTQHVICDNVKAGATLTLKNAADTLANADKLSYEEKNALPLATVKGSGKVVVSRDSLPENVKIADAKLTEEQRDALYKVDEFTALTDSLAQDFPDYIRYGLYREKPQAHDPAKEETTEPIPEETVTDIPAINPVNPDVSVEPSVPTDTATDVTHPEVQEPKPIPPAKEEIVNPVPDENDLTHPETPENKPEAPKPTDPTPVEPEKPVDPTPVEPEKPVDPIPVEPEQPVNPAPRAFAPVIEAYANTRYYGLTNIESLTQRQGQAHFNDDGAFAQITHDRLASTLNNSSLSMQTTRLRVGAEKSRAVDTGRVTYGFDVKALRGTADIGERKIDTTLTGFGAAAFSTYLRDNGAYIDTVVGFDHLKSGLDMIDTAFHANAFYGSLELGHRLQDKNGWFLKPQVQAKYAYLPSEKAGHLALSHMNSLQIRAGLEAGRVLSKDTIISAHFEKVKELTAEQTLTSADGSHRSTIDYGAAHLRGGVSLNMHVNRNTTVYSDVQVRFAGAMRTRASANVGLRYRF